MAKQHEPRNAVFIKKGWFIFWCIVCPPIAFLYVVCADSVIGNDNKKIIRFYGIRASFS